MRIAGSISTLVMFVGTAGLPAQGADESREKQTTRVYDVSGLLGRLSRHPSDPIRPQGGLVFRGGLVFKARDS